MSRVPQVKNRAPAPIQITAEQILREAKERGLEDVVKPPEQFITDREELMQYQQTKRKDFEDQIRRQRQQIGLWCRYALWEASQKEFERARSVFERALDVDYRCQTVWQKYTEMEMKNKFINHARNLWDRAVTLLPRVDTFWYKYSYMEELVGAIELARQVFERWMKWEPDDMGWAAYIKFEMRQGETDRARALYERYVKQLPTCRAYLKYARWEEGLRDRARARGIYERALQELHPYEKTEKLLVNFARFEERCKEFDRARVIYKYALHQFQDSENVDEVSELKKEYLAFEKRHGNREGIEDAIISSRREQYEDLLTKDRYDYDVWFDYIRLEEAEGDPNRIRKVYERAVDCVPPITEKRYWRRYIYLWINYALYEELVERNAETTRAVYKACLNMIPHKKFTFGKIWLMAANFEVRQKDLGAARKLLGQGIGMCAKENIFKGYIQLEHQLGEIDRCRTIYAKYLEFTAHSSSAWIAFGQFEATLGEAERARAIFELATSQSELDMPELLWKAYIDFEITEQEVERARKLFERLLDRSNHVKVWISFAKFESDMLSTSDLPKEGEHIPRSVFQRGYDTLKRQGLKEERVLLLEAWRDYENNRYKAAIQEAEKNGLDTDAVSNQHLKIVEEKFPRKIKMRRPVENSLDDEEMEDYYDYVFPDDEKKIVGMKILEQAMKWKQMAAPAAEAEATSAKMGNDDELDIDNEVPTILGKRGLEV